MKAQWTILLALFALVAPAMLFGQEGAGPPDENADAEPEKLDGVEDGFYAVVVSVEGPEDESWAELNGEEITAPGERVRYQETTQVFTGIGCTVVLSMETVTDGVAQQNAMLAVRQDSDIMIDKLSLKNDSLVTRLAIRSGEIRVKVTEQREDYSTDMKVSTPNATASVRGTDVNQIGYSATKGTYAAVASGSITASRSNGTQTSVGAGGSADDQNETALDKQLADSTQIIAPLGMVAYEVSVGQLSISGPERPASDLNNPGTNPTAGRAGAESGASDVGREQSEPPA